MDPTAKCEVTVIPATKRAVRNGGQLKEQRFLRVAAYCRVSTGDESQQTSYTSQKAFYTSLINRKEGWTMVDIYADEALSGTSRVKRTQFNRMMSDAAEGRIDYIVTKSISRFARNTVDTLGCVRQLQQQTPPVGVYFERENIDTLDAKGELILTILSALAQDESRSISDNIRWTFQKNFQDGKPQINLNRMLGYDKGPDGVWVINEAQAEIVRFIFEQYLCGWSANRIAKRLNESGKTTVNGNRWSASTVLVILRNEKYVGDLAMQKTVTKDFLTHRSTVNRGEAPMYYVKDHHAAIVSRDSWDRVQLLLRQGSLKKGPSAEAAEPRRRRTRAAPLVELTCGHCGEVFARMSYSACAKSAGDAGEQSGMGQRRYSYTVYRCKGKYGGGKGRPGRLSNAAREAAEQKCPSKVLYGVAIEQSFMEVMYAIRRDYRKNGDASDIVRQFQAASERVQQREKHTRHSPERLALLQDQLRELEERYDSARARQAEAMRGAAIETECCAGLAADLKRQIVERRKEQRELESMQSQAAIMGKQFDLFLSCLLELPGRNAAGMELNVNGLDPDRSSLADCCSVPGTDQRHVTQAQIEAAPDYLDFSRGLYHAFVVRGEVTGDMITYTTSFGVPIVTVGNGRKLADFLGFRSCTPDGAVTLMTEPWQVVAHYDRR
ncbi:MAG: recombinase family protein [Clostridiales bacterium]|nr:recombinase family protein [Clostridiales bacterium]